MGNNINRIALKPMALSYFIDNINYPKPSLISVLR